MYVTGSSPITRLEVADPTEALEVYPDRALLDPLAGPQAEVRPSFGRMTGWCSPSPPGCAGRT